jgi:hypothetical protein
MQPLLVPLAPSLRPGSTHSAPLSGPAPSICLEGLGLNQALTSEQHLLDAELSIDDVVIGKGGFDGRLPIGPHEISVQRKGYKTTRFTLQSSNDTPFFRVISLAPEPTHPLWRKDSRPLFVASSFEVAMAPLFAGSLQSSAEKKATGGPLHGGLGLARLGWIYTRFPSLTFNLSFGYLGARREIARSIRSSFEVEGEKIPIHFDIQDNLYAYGPFMTLGLDKRLPFSHKRLELRLGLGAGLGLLTSGDLTMTTATSGGSTMMANMEPNSDPESSLMVLLTPEVDLKYKLGPFDFRAGLMVVASLLDGKNWVAREIRLTGCPEDTNPTDVSCGRREDARRCAGPRHHRECERSLRDGRASRMLAWRG